MYNTVIKKRDVQKIKNEDEYEINENDINYDDLIVIHYNMGIEPRETILR